MAYVQLRASAITYLFSMKYSHLVCFIALTVTVSCQGPSFLWTNSESHFLQVIETPTGNDFTQVSGRGNHSVALRADGSLVSWGYDGDSQVTDTPTSYRWLDRYFIQISGGNNHSVALRADGTLASWGWDGEGQVSNTPTTNDFTQVSAGYMHSVAIKQ